MARLIILSTGRSGTTYIHRCLSHLGVKFGHEKLDSQGGIGWNFAIDFKRSCDIVLHQVREPFACISSLTSFTPYHWERVRKVYGKEMPEDHPAKAIWFYITWNKRCEKLADKTYRLEDIYYGSERANGLLEILGVNKPWPPITTMETTINARPHAVYSINDVPEEYRKELLKMSKRYGYKEQNGD